MGNADSKSEDTVAVSPPPKESSSNGYASSPPPQLDHHEKREADALRSAPRDVRQRDDQIHVQMAMADLMAYLQVVANNSNHLPLTRRDDPELDRTVSTLSAEDFGRKSAAFVPADVRVLGGTFTRYGRVWDLPTSEEYNACDGAQEPGRSYGGAFCNTMLKVVYDAANEMEGAAQTEAAAQALFEDDEEEDEPSVTGGRSYKSIEFGPSLGTQPQITWSALLRQLKSEFKEIGYSQVPKLTTTRKMDLQQPFCLVGDNFDAAKGHKKRSLLIGCNYRSIEGAELKASHDDIRSMKDYIVNVHGFSEDKESMIILLDDENFAPPTFHNIIDAFKILSEESQPGDAVFVQFSGHGGRVLDAPVDAEAESYDEVICPMDYEHTGLIRDTLIFKTLLAPMRYGVTLTVLIDCCDTGMVLELPYAWNAKSDKRNSSVAKLSMNEDFSFVRFLKVVKTLYESSTFTQLGKTVGSALNPMGGPMYNNNTPAEGDDHRKKNKPKSSERANSNGESLLDTWTSACMNGPNDAVRREDTMMSQGDGSTLTTTRKAGGDTLLETMMRSCTLLASPPDDFSDEDTFKTRTDEDSLYNSESFESSHLTEEYERHRRRSKRR